MHFKTSTFAPPFGTNIPPTGGYMQNLLSRVWFLNQGCRQVPLNAAKNHVRWGHPGGYFLNALGQKIADSYSPSHQRGDRPYNHGVKYPRLRECGPDCHILMALAFYGPRPTFIEPKTGKEYVGICHHLIPDKRDYRPANLLCWLTREQHAEAERRQRALRIVLPDMHAIPYERHRYLQDPRTMSAESFEIELRKLQEELKHFTYNPSDRMAYDFTHHMEC